MKRDASKELFWRQAVGECRDSGQSVRKFCKERALKEGLFYAWRRELGRRDAGMTAKAGFVELRVRPAVVKEGAGISIQVDERVRVILECGFDAEALNVTLRCLCAVQPPERGGRAPAETRAEGVRAP